VKKLLIAMLVSISLVFSGAAARAEVVTELPTDIPSIKIIPGSTINLVSRESKVPVRIQNDFNADIRVFVHMRPSNPRVVVPSAVEIVVPALSSVNAQVPVKAIANGKVFLIVWLTTFSGLRLGPDSNLQMIVNADLELALLVGFGFAVVLLLIFGTIRTLRRRKTREID
jgi:hypothetical protein